ncbi:MAG: HAD-IC family P-type ATPase, partial [Syntrophomonadaceae bacterium]|nr:HAD-IC family P-type ATPase [Syntrophomonadaceae bacterium]
METMNWWTMTAEECMELLRTSPQGLHPTEARVRGRRFSNRLETEHAPRPLALFLRQFTDTMVLVLLGAAVISGLIGAMADAVTIMVIVLLNAVLGFIQEYSAEKSLEEIRKLSAPTAQVLRDGRRLQVDSATLVPGDIVLLENGARVPSDMRLLQSISLAADEAVLTGESVPVEKDESLSCADATPLAERQNMVYMGTSVVRGRGRGIVTGVGADTEMGRIAAGISQEREALTPLQQRLNQLGKILIVICIAVCALVAAMGWMRGEPLMSMLLAGISLAVAAIPEGLPAIVTISLAIGVKRMAARNAVVRKLPAVETLGCTTVICSDKTGTLTCNRMAVQRVAAGGREYEAESMPAAQLGPALTQVLNISTNCNNAELYGNDDADLRVEGEPTEAALLMLAAQQGHFPSGERLQEFPFDSRRKRMSVVVEQNGQQYLLVKGAADSLLELCTHWMRDEASGAAEREGIREQLRDAAVAVSPLDRAQRRRFLDVQQRWANDALRVLGFAWRRLEPGSWERY